MKKKNYIIFMSVAIFLIAGCQNAKDALTGKKRNNNDEFLIEKKNPLVLPPNFNELPTPKRVDNSTNTKNQDEFDIKKILGKSSTVEKTDALSQKKDNKLKESILKKINKY